MPSGYERLDNSGADHKDEHGIPLYPLRADEAVAVAPSAPAHETHVHVTVAAPAAAAPAPAPAAAADGLYCGESHGLYQPITHNEVVERHGVVSAAPAPIAIGAAAPAPVVGMVSAPGVTGASPYPAQAYAAAYPQLPVQQHVAPPQPPQLPMPPSPAHAHGSLYHAGAPLMVAVPVMMPPPPQPLVSVVPPVPQTYAQLKAMLDTRFVAFDTGRYLREGWAFTRHNLCRMIAGMLMWAVIGAAIYVGLWAIFIRAHWERQCWAEMDDEGDSMESGYYYDCGRGFPWGRIVRELLFELFFAAPIAAGFIATLFEAIRDNTYIKFRTFFSGFSCPYYLRLLGLTLVVSLLTRLLSLLFVIPGVYFAIVTTFALPLHLQFRHIPLRSWHAITLSIKTLHRNCCSFFGFLLACALLNVLGALCLVVGLLVTVPLTMAACAYCYHHLVGVNGAAVIVPADTAAAYQQQAAAYAAAAAPAPAPLNVQALPIGQPVPLAQGQPQVVVVVSPHASAAPQYRI